MCTCTHSMLFYLHMLFLSCRPINGCSASVTFFNQERPLSTLEMFSVNSWPQSSTKKASTHLKRLHFIRNITAGHNIITHAFYYLLLSSKISIFIKAHFLNSVPILLIKCMFGITFVCSCSYMVHGSDQCKLQYTYNTLVPRVYIIVINITLSVHVCTYNNYIQHFV